MKLTCSLLCLSLLAALSLTSCSNNNGEWDGYQRAAHNGPTYISTKYEPMSFGGHGGGYGNGYAIWPMPTENYAEYWADDEDPNFVGNSWWRSEHDFKLPQRAVIQPVPQSSSPRTYSK